MAYFFPEGASFQFSQTFASAKTITAITNASSAVATCTAHGFSTGDEILLTSGWEDATDTVYKVTSIDANTFSIQGLNTTNTAFFPTGTGIGSAQKVSGWTNIPQVLTISSSGGDAKFTTITPLAKRNAINVPVGFNATSVTLTMGHDPSDVNYQTMVSISRTLSKVALKEVLSGGAVVYGYGYLNVSEQPSMNNGQANTVQAALTMLGRAISY